VLDTAGRAFTVTVTNALFVLVQPAALVPLTLYAAVAAGVYEMPLTGPPVHVYVDAPEPVKITGEPLQINVAEALALTTGNGLTETETTAVVEQPALETPVTVYEVLAEGVKETAAVVSPVFHEYVVAPDAVYVTACPKQMTVLLPATVTKGKGLTDTDCMAVFVQPADDAPVTV
jgi:hypothetical protein